MSDERVDDRAWRGAGLPEQARAQLERLGVQVERLRQLAQPPARDGDAPRLGHAQWVSSLELLAQQVDQLLNPAWQPGIDVAGAAQPTHQAPALSSEPSSAEPYPDHTAPPERLVYGVTMDQWDALDRLMQALQAHGDVVSASNMADFAPGTLTMVGHAIFDGAMEVREILDQVEMQQLPETANRRSDVAEDPAGYTIGIAPEATVDGSSAPLQWSYWPPTHAGQCLH